MKHPKIWSFVAWIGIFLAISSTALAQIDDDDDDEITAPREPVQIYLQASLSDQVNVQITEDRLRRVLALVDKYRTKHPDAGVTATIFFSGAASKALAQRNPQTHLVDVVKDHVRRGAIEVGYDGTNEPIDPKQRVAEFKSDIGAARWTARATVAERLLTEGSDPNTRALRPGTAGGLKEMQEVFGEASAITGVRTGLSALANVMPDLGNDAEIVHEVRRYNQKAIMFGLPDENPLHSVTYRGWSTAFSNELSPFPIAPPELFWANGVLHLSEAVGVDNQMFQAYNGAGAFSYVIKRLDRERIRIIHVELGTDRNYLAKPFREEAVYPPTRYAATHPGNPQLPAEALLPKNTVDYAFSKEDELLDWLSDDFIPDHPGVQFVSNSSLKQLTPPGSGFDIPQKALHTAVQQMLKNWGDQNTPPKYLNVGEVHFLSLAQLFQVLADDLAEQNRSGKLPERVRVADVNGPLEMMTDSASVAGETTAGSVAQAAAGLVAKLHDAAWSPVPNNVVPSDVKVGGLDLNPAQFLRLMAEAVMAASPDAKLTVKSEGMFASQTYLGMRTRAARDMGVVWTYKPAALLLDQQTRSTVDAFLGSR